MPMLQLLAAPFTAFFVVLATTPLVEDFARKHDLLDRPGGRHLHSRAVPRLGGVALFAGLAAGGLVLAAAGPGAGAGVSRTVAAVAAGAAVVWLVGLLDDLRGLSPAAKLAGQALGAAVSVALGLRVEFVTLPGLWGSARDQVLHLGPVSVPFTLLWLVGLSNAVNLLDGLDGLAAGVVAIATVPTAFAAYGRGFPEAAGLLAVLGAGCLAFLRYNFAPARIFMGDSGALLLGFVFGAAAAAGTAKGPAAMTLLVPVVSLGVPLLDTAWAVIRRLRAGRPVAEADCEHLHHRLLAGGRMEAWQVVVLLYGVTAALAALASVLPPRSRPGVGLAMALAVAAVGLWLSSRARCRAVQPARRVEAAARGSAGDAGLRYPARGYQAGPGHPHPRGLSRL